MFLGFQHHKNFPFGTLILLILTENYWHQFIKALQSLDICQFFSFIFITYKRCLIFYHYLPIFSQALKTSTINYKLLENTFITNGYRSQLIDSIVPTPKSPTVSAPKKLIYLPCTGSPSLQIRSKVNRKGNAAIIHVSDRSHRKSSNL